MQRDTDFEMSDPPSRQSLSKTLSQVELRLVWKRSVEGVKTAWVAMPKIPIIIIIRNIILPCLHFDHSGNLYS
jgi:hypothetical protein